MYKDEILKLINDSPLEIDTDIEIGGRPPTMATSNFLTNKEQGDWAETIAYKAINEYNKDFFAVRYGRSESISAGDDGFSDFYIKYQEELNLLGKMPDLLIFKTSDFPSFEVDIENDEHISRAVAAIEVRSSSFLAEKYSDFMENRCLVAKNNCEKICKTILSDPNLSAALLKKNETIFNLIKNANEETFRELTFRLPSWSVTPELRRLVELLRTLKENIKILHIRDYLSITPKMEDLALVNRWIQRYNVKHFYLQVFFDKAYIISFRNILSLVADEDNEGRVFSVEKDVKNQQKTTIKINVQVGNELIGKIDMPKHKSQMKLLERGRLLFYVTFQGGKGYLDNQVFIRDVINE